MKIIKKLKCKRLGIPYKIENEWYNYMSMVGSEPKNIKHQAINIFDIDGHYIVPKKGNIAEVIFHDGRRAFYRITNIIFGNRNRDWLHNYDWIDCDLVFVKIEEK
jgi:hypothetical protein